MGWKTQVTKASGDQGCDVLAVKGRARVAIQCKYYSKPIGNKGVQEINAAKSYYPKGRGINTFRAETSKYFFKTY